MIANLSKSQYEQTFLQFLDSFRKTETQDSYAQMDRHLQSYSEYIYCDFSSGSTHPDVEPDKRPKPPVIENIPKLKRKETSIYKPSDLWTQQDDLLFLRYCPTKREKCYHAHFLGILSAGRHEILKLKIRDIVF